MSSAIAAAAHTIGSTLLRLLIAALNDPGVRAKIYRIQRQATRALLNAAGERARKNLADRTKKHWTVG